jgi:tetratricopeptide (TPR) repeat protein
MKDYYAILGISENASKEEVKEACHILINRFHPDKPQGDEKMFKDVQEAYRVLYPNESRAQYDAAYGVSRPIERRETVTKAVKPVPETVRTTKPAPIVSWKKRKKLVILIAAVFVVIAASFGIWKYVDNTKNGPVKDDRQEGLEKFSQGSFQEASDLLGKNGAEEKDPEVLLKLGASFYNQRKYDEAIESYEKAIRLNEDNALAYNSLANAYRDKKEADKAIEAYRKAIEKDPKYPLAYSNLAILLMDAGKIDQSRAVIDEALKILPDSQELKNIHSYLEK